MSLDVSSLCDGGSFVSPVPSRRRLFVSPISSRRKGKSSLRSHHASRMARKRGPRSMKVKHSMSSVASSLQLLSLTKEGAAADNREKGAHEQVLRKSKMWTNRNLPPTILLPICLSSEGGPTKRNSCRQARKLTPRLTMRPEPLHTEPRCMSYDNALAFCGELDSDEENCNFNDRQGHQTTTPRRPCIWTTNAGTLDIPFISTPTKT
uniref:Uncharacterized protein n=2 Tax=Odontella aurita TaxID=265563 RepID=A0A7S4JBK1_9STRA|mmetsp:Transcript_43253/g.131660  ORF Transcript_43253/g.131660 Transcript_43253/m.131660 type:complete len:207 (+) Transcript_43253:212-832(+)